MPSPYPLPSPLSPAHAVLSHVAEWQAARLLVMRLAVRVGALAAAGGQWRTTLALVLWLVVYLGSSSPIRSIRETFVVWVR
jgi:hypothetical protein